MLPEEFSLCYSWPKALKKNTNGRHKVKAVASASYRPVKRAKTSRRNLFRVQNDKTRRRDQGDLMFAQGLHRGSLGSTAKIRDFING